MLRRLSKARNLFNKVVLVRVDFNVPIAHKHIVDDARLHASVPTINYLRDRGAKVVLITHMGRPQGKMMPTLRVNPLLPRLSDLLGTSVVKLDTRNWKLTNKRKLELIEDIERMRPGTVAMMENIRFAADEKKNTGVLAQELAALADMFVLDGFAVAHRDTASVTGVAQHLPSYAGLLLQKEQKALNKLLRKPKKPFVAVLGGAKMETKIPVMKHLSQRADTILLGGGIVTTYFWAKGYKVGDSIRDTSFKKEILSYGKKRHVIVPVDLVVGTVDGKSHRIVDVKRTPHSLCKKGEAIFDIGPKTIQKYATYIKGAKTLVWNGAMGYFEQAPYYVGTMAIARLIASVAKGSAYGVIGGGETIQAMDYVGMGEYVDHVSTGGGAMLAYLANETVPGIDAVSYR